ncbi:unnamed protein product [Schistosoma margrebowiei]|uniref:Uncharacterized protein n=1 Tax=Schistosoma margrebowiei TaxID=48269 RepID=A0AA85A2Z0_9TREM|nr:unnamed protein product [Schistosoma margrebowiei]
MFNPQWTLSNLSLLLSAVLNLSEILHQQQLLLLIITILVVLRLLLISLILIHYYFNHSSHCYLTGIFEWFNNYLPSSHSLTSPFSYFVELISLPSSAVTSSLLLSLSWIFCIRFGALSIWFWKSVCYLSTRFYHQKDILLFFGNSINDIRNYRIYSKINVILLTLHTDSIIFIYNLISGWNSSDTLKSIDETSKRLTQRKRLSHGMSTLFTIYFGLLIYLELCGIDYAESRPISTENERRYGNLDLHPAKSSSQQKTPKVVMPPYDLGFKGQKTDELNKVKLYPLSSSSLSYPTFLSDFNDNFDQIKGFQSDETYVRDSQTQQQQRKQHYQRVSRDNFNSQEETDNGDNNNAVEFFNTRLMYDSKLSQSNHINKNSVSYGQSPSVSSSIPSLTERETNERLDYRRVNLAPSKSTIQKQISHSPYNPYTRMNNYQESLYIPDQQTMYEMNTQQYPREQEKPWTRKDNNNNKPNQRHELYDGYTAQMNRENPSSWFPFPNYQTNNNNPLNNKPLYSQQSNIQHQHQPSSNLNSYSYYSNLNKNIDSNDDINKRNPLSYFSEISDIELSHLIYQYQMELLRRQSERLPYIDYQMEHNYYGQPAESSSHYLPKGHSRSLPQKKTS